MQRVSVGKLRHGAGHVLYEVDMLRKATHLLWLMKEGRIRFPDQATGHTFFNCILESFLIHLRNLYQFFYTFKYRRLRPNDIQAIHFLTVQTQFKAQRHPQSKIPRRILKRIDRSLAHLSYSRNYYSFKRGGWNVPKLTREMELTIQAFKEALPRSRVPWFSSL